MHLNLFDPWKLIVVENPPKSSVISPAYWLTISINLSNQKTNQLSLENPIIARFWCQKGVKIQNIIQKLFKIMKEL